MVSQLNSLIIHPLLLFYHLIFFLANLYLILLSDEPVTLMLKKLLIIQNSLEIFKFPSRFSQTKVVAGVSF